MIPAAINCVKRAIILLAFLVYVESKAAGSDAGLVRFTCGCTAYLRIDRGSTNMRICSPNRCCDPRSWRAEPGLRWI